MRPNRKDHRHHTERASKKPKNFVYCTSCQRSKMLFQSKEEADRFIKFNSDTILEESGKAPNRSYYCQLCAGWHVTSLENEGSASHFDRRDQKLAAAMDCYAKEDPTFAPFAEKAHQLLEKAKLFIQQKGNYDEAEECLALLSFELNDKEFPPKYETKFRRIKTNYRNLSKLIDCLRLVDKMSLKQMEAVNENIAEYRKLPGFVPIFRNLYKERQIQAILQSVKQSAPSLEEWAVRKNEIEHIIEEIQHQGEMFIKPRIRRELINIDMLLRSINDQHNTKREKNLSANEKNQFIKIIEKLERVQKAFEAKDFAECQNILNQCIWDTQYLPQNHSDVKNLQAILSTWVQKVSDALI